MSINYAELEKIVSELKDFVVGSTCKKITQYSKNALTIELRKQNKDLSIIIFIDPKNTFLGIGNFWHQAPKNPYHFTMVARKYLDSMVVKDFYSEKNDRILHFVFDNCSIIAELLGKNGNVFLINNENYIQAVLHNRIGEKRIEKEGYKYIGLGTKTQKEFSIREEFNLNPKISFTEKITSFYLKRISIEKIESQIALIRNELIKKNQYLEKIVEELENVNPLSYKETADLILQNLNDINKIKEKLKIKYIESKTAVENAQYFYELYKKQLRKKEQLSEFIDNLKNQIEELTKKIEILNENKKKVENNEISPYKILFKENEIKDEKSNQQTKKDGSSLYNIITLENGKKLVYGKSSAGNNVILKKFGKGNFWWFHVRDYQGPFVILMDENLTNEDIKIASIFALHFSKGKNAGKTSVIYTRCKYVKPIPKILGKVTYSKEKEILASDDTNLVKKLLQSNEEDFF
ncbi:MAG: NFACT family protein [Exilispira sp.]|jgi:predicted ribosome quality control (RQC) complex YloA/Tae2 family protein|nr:NFACT family protein [Exilispira sp.]